MLLEGKVAIVTGAARGIGFAVSEAFIKQGAKVVVVDIDGNVAKEACDKLGENSLPLSCDVANSKEVGVLVQKAVEHFGTLDILINNAGVSKPAMVYKMTEEQWDSVIGVHLKGTFNCTHEASKIMKEKKWGRIINVTSYAGMLGTIGQVNYSAAKAGIAGFTRSAAKELAKYNVLVNAIAPGAATRMTHTIITDERFKDSYLQRIPLGRWADPAEVAPSFVFLASDWGSYITGQILAVDGGLTIR